MPETIALRVERLKALRELRGWSQRELSRQCGLALNVIGTYERGDVEPTAKHLKAIAEKLVVSADYLLGLSDDPRGQVGNNELNDDERVVLDTFRLSGWAGIARLGVDRLTR